MTDDKKKPTETMQKTADERAETLEHLAEDDLENISGGNLAQWIICDKDYRSGNTPKYTVGQRVHVAVNMKTHYDGFIEAVGGKTGGINNTEFVYSVRVFGNQFQRQMHPEGWVEEGIYESNLKAL